MPEDRVKRQTHAHQLAGNQAFSKGKKSWGRPWKHSRNQTQMALTGANGGRTGREITPFRQHKTANSQEFLTWHYRGPHGNRNAYHDPRHGTWNTGKLWLRSGCLLRGSVWINVLQILQFTTDFGFISARK